MDHELIEKIGSLTAKVDAAHKRVDKVEQGIREDLKELSRELKELNSYMNKGKGWAAAFMLLSGASGAGILSLINYLFHK